MGLDDLNILGIEVHEKKKFKSYVFHNKNYSNEDLLLQIDELNKNKDDWNYSNRLMFEMYNSNKIEGNTLTNQDTKLILENKVIPEGASYRDFQECVSLNRTINKFRKISDLSLDLVLSIHRELTVDLLDDCNSGKIRNCPVYISNCLHVPPSNEKVLDLLNASIDKFNSSKRGLIDIFIFKLEFVSIHPFTDGNGRTSRIIMNGLLENLGYPRLIISDKNKKFYYKALEDAQVKYMISGWIRYCLLLMKFNLEYLNDISVIG